MISAFLTPEMCPHCASSAPVVMEAEDCNWRVTAEQFRYRRCTRCGLIFLDRVPTDLGSYYPKGYHVTPKSAEDLAAYLPAEGYKMEALIRASPGPALLEIGPSFGAFAHLAKQSGFDVRTIEMDAECSRFLASALGIPTINTADVAGALARLDDLDAVAMWHSLEHMPDALNIAAAAARTLRPGGALLVASPNPAALQMRLFGRYWVHLDAPRHVCLVPPKVLEAALYDAGCRLESLTTNDQGSKDCSGLGWQVSPLNAIGRRHGSRWLRYPGRLLGRVLRGIEAREGNGAAYTAVFRRAA